MYRNYCGGMVLSLQILGFHARVLRALRKSTHFILFYNDIYSLKSSISSGSTPSRCSSPASFRHCSALCRLSPLHLSSTTMRSVTTTGSAEWVHQFLRLWQSRYEGQIISPPDFADSSTQSCFYFSAHACHRCRESSTSRWNGLSGSFFCSSMYLSELSS